MSAKTKMHCIQRINTRCRCLFLETIDGWKVCVGNVRVRRKCIGMRRIRFRGDSCLSDDTRVTFTCHTTSLTADSSLLFILTQDGSPSAGMRIDGPAYELYGISRYLPIGQRSDSF